MADLIKKNRASNTRITGADATTGAETEWVGASANNDLQTVDRLDNGGADTSVAVTAGTPVQIKVGGSNRTERKLVIIQPDGKILFGFSAGTQNFRVFKDQIMYIALGPNSDLWVDSVSGVVNVSVGEAS